MNDVSNFSAVQQPVSDTYGHGMDDNAEQGSTPPASVSQSLDTILALLQIAADEMHAVIDQTEFRRSVDSLLNEQLTATDATAIIHGVLTGSSMAGEVRLDLFTATAADAARLVRPAAPIATFWVSATGVLQWLLITDFRGRKVRVVDSAERQGRWLTLNDLRKMCCTGAERTHQWLALQPLIMSGVDAPGESIHYSPWSRLLSMLAPERGDITIIVVFAVFVGLLALSTPIAVESLVNTISFGQLLQPVIVLAMLLFTLLAFGAAMRALQVYVAEIIQRRLFVRIAGDLAIRLPRVRNEYWTSHYGPELINRFFEVVTVQKVTTLLLLDGTALVLQAIVGMAVIAFYHPILLGFDIALIALIVVIVFVLGRGAVATSIDESREKYATAAWLEELARHPIAFRSSGGLSLAIDNADRLITSYVRSRSKHFRILMRQMLAALTLQVLASTALLGLGGWLVIRGELTLGQLVAAELIVTVIIGSFAKVAKYLESYYDLMASMDKLGHLFDMPMYKAGGARLENGSAGIAVSVHDLSSRRLISGRSIRNASLQIAADSRVAIVGPDPALRRMLLESIGGLQPPAHGHVDLDESDIRRLRLDSIQDQVAVVGEPEVFAGTVAQNIHVGRTNVGEDDIRRALRDVGLLDLVLDLPNGLDTSITTDGRHFTPDQLARLMLARAIAAKPRLLLVDSILDTIPDDVLSEAISSLYARLNNCTCVISTGRGEIISACNLVITVDSDGNVAATSPPPA
ncbi:MAG: ATP-binding cassette domain-containing protein [Pirellulales bacterium]